MRALAREAAAAFRYGFGDGQLTPNDFRSLPEVEARLLAFQRYYERIATPFEWRFTRDDLAALMRKLDDGRTAPPVAA